MSRQEALRLAGIAGIVFAVGNLAAGFMVPAAPPSTGDSAEDFLAFLSDHRRLWLLSSAINILLIIPAVVFIAGFWRILRAADSEDGVLALAASLAFIVAGGVFVVSSGWSAGIAFLSDGHGLNAAAAKDFLLIGAIFNQAVFGPIAAALGFGGYLLAKRGPYPAWVGWAGVAVAVVGAASVFALREDDPLAPFSLLPLAAFVLFDVWVVLLSVFMVRGKA